MYIHKGGMKMASQKVLNSDFTVKDGTVVLTETVEKQLNQTDLLNSRAQLLMRQGQMEVQLAEIKNQVTKIDTMLASLEKGVE